MTVPAAPSAVHSPSTGVAIPATWGAAVNSYIGWLGPNRPRCRARKTSSQTIGGSSYTAVTFDVEDFDVGGCHSTASQPERFVAPEDGIYRVEARVPFTANTTGIRVARLRFEGGVTAYLDIDHTEGTAVGHPDPPGVGSLVSMQAGDYVVVEVWQDSGGSLAVDVTGFPAPWFTIEWVAPL